MYKYVQSEREVSAMSTINPQLNRQLSIDVVVFDNNEGPIPHVHVYLDKTRDPRKCSVVRLDCAEYSTHHGEPVVRMNKKQKREFIKSMTSKWNKYALQSDDGSYYTPTGYQMCVNIWADAFEGNSYEKFTLDTNGVPVMPDYETL